MISFCYQLKAKGVELQLTETSKKLFSKSEINLNLSEWDKLSDFNQVEALGVIRNAEYEGGDRCHAIASEKGYFLSFEFISNLSNTQAKALNFPDTFPYQIDIKTSSNIGAPNFNIGWTAYVRGKPIAIRKNGCFVSHGSQTYRLPRTLFDVINLIDQYNAQTNPSFDAKTQFIAELKTKLPETSDTAFNFEGELQQISLQHASAISLQIVGDQNTLSFNPILFHKNIKEKSTEQLEIIDESEQILTPNEARNFSASFKNTNDVKATYLLDKGKYVFIDEAIRPALKAVKTASNFPREKRIDFAQSPQKYIKEILDEELGQLSDIDREIQSAQVDELFIETSQFSERVTEIGVWEAPDLPWLEREPNEWRSDNYSFFVQGKLINFPSGDIEDVVTQLKESIEQGRPSIAIGNEIIVPDKELLKTLEGLLTQKPSKPVDPDNDGKDNDDDDETEDEKVKGPIVPLTKENFEAVEYNRQFTPRTDCLDASPPECLNPGITLKAHQLKGVEWLTEAYNRGFPGVLMADDMGLGKTLQSLAFLAIMVESGKTDTGSPILIVAPVGLLKNWEEEHEKHLSYPGLGSFAKLYGNSLKEFKTGKGRDIDSGTAILNAEEFKKYDWLLTTYETLRDYQASFAQLRFSCVVFDELQKAKNPRSLVSKGTKVLNSDFSIGLTGTPVENTLADLWTIMDILSPGRLGDLKGFLEEYPEPDQESPAKGIAKLKSLSAKLLEPSPNGPPPILRRMKTELKDADLPEKKLVPSAETTLQMPTIQEQAYRDVSNKLNSKSIKMIDAIQQFRAISRNPISAEQATQLSIDDFINSSARLQATFKVLDEIHSKNEKVLLFLENRALQPILASMVKQRYNMVSQPLIINGLISGDARQKKVNAFQSGGKHFDAIIISPKAGGVGLTLTAANNVVHVDRWWNPAVEDQCTDRAYRIGQTKTVYVYTPISRSLSMGDKSFDCILDKLLEKKRNLATGVFVPTTIDSEDFAGAFEEQKVQTLSLEEIDCLEKGADFEDAVINIIRRAGLSAKRTQTSYDYGADIIVVNDKTEKTAIIQCKHRADYSKNISEEAAREAINAKAHYELRDPSLFVVTNAQSATSNCQSLCEESGINLITRKDLLSVGNILAHKLSD